MQNQDINKKLEKRFQTTMIGALAQFEENFGFLWAINKEDNLSEQEMYFSDLWEKTRIAILNNGNSQLRSALAELNKISTFGKTNNRYHYKFYMNKENRGDSNNEN